MDRSAWCAGRRAGIVLLCCLLLLPGRSVAWDLDLSGARVRTGCGTTDGHCVEGLRGGLQLDFWQSEGFDPDTSLPGFRFWWNGRSSNFLGGLIIAAGVLLLVWGVFAVLALVFSGRIVTGIYGDIDRMTGEEAHQLEGYSGGFTLGTYPFDAIDLQISFALGVRHSRYSDAGNTVRFNGYGGRLGIGYVPAIDASGPVLKYERERWWGEHSEISDGLPANLDARFSRNEVYLLGWSFALGGAESGGR